MRDFAAGASRICTAPANRVPTRSAWPWFVLAAAVVLADRLSKIAVLESFFPGETRTLTGFFNLVLVFNKGAAFSFLAGAPGWQTPLFAAIALAAAIVISALIFRHAGKKMFCAGLALILGGAIGNLIDRLRFGHVVDFLDLHALGWHWTAFNLERLAIIRGAAL